MTEHKREGFTNRLRHVASPATIVMFGKARKGRDPFGCLLCGHVFVAGDGYRWIYANDGVSPWRGGNFFVCDGCDKGDEACRERAAAINRSVNNIMKERMYVEPLASPPPSPPGPLSKPHEAASLLTQGTHRTAVGHCAGPLPGEEDGEPNPIWLLECPWPECRHRWESCISSVHYKSCPGCHCSLSFNSARTIRFPGEPAARESERGERGDG